VQLWEAPCFSVTEGWYYTHAPPEGVAAPNNIIAEHLVVIHSARPIASQLSLDVEGLAVVRGRSAVCDVWDEASTLAERIAQPLVQGRGDDHSWTDPDGRHTRHARVARSQGRPAFTSR
jgi:hypothetical protein